LRFETSFRGFEALEMANFFLYQHISGAGDETDGSFAPQARRFAQFTSDRARKGSQNENLGCGVG
jgi:hypothetical protein